jgi:hypothetical protein
MASSESPKVAQAFADCHDYNQKVDMLVIYVKTHASDADGEALINWLNDQKHLPSGPRAFGGPGDETPVGPETVTTRIETKRDADEARARVKEFEQSK